MTTLALLDPTHFVSSWGYAAIFILSLLQSCCVPTSSELTLGFGGVLASQGTLNLGGVIAAGTAGELVGAYIAWWVGRVGGRAAVDRYGKYVLLSHRDLDRAEAWYQRHERWGVLISRLLPVIRNFVAVPAGVARVPAPRFGVLTAIGSLIWTTAMALIGYSIGGQWHSVMKGFSDAGYVLAVLAVLAIAFVIWHRWRSYKEATGEEAAARARGESVHPSSAPGAARAAYPSSARSGRRASGRLITHDAMRVPARITAVFWAVKLLSTAFGESVSDALVKDMNKYAGVFIGFIIFVAAMWIQLRAGRYGPWRYWGAVCAVAIFGTQAADVMHIVLHIPYIVSSVFYLVLLLVVLRLWSRSEGTLSIHSVRTPRREVFYWLTVLFTFALGTAVGDLTATTFKLGYLKSGILFAVLFALPGLAFWLRGKKNAVAMFWIAYILTRPFGASFSDWFGFGKHEGGIGLGHPVAALIFLVPILFLVAYTNATRLDVERPRRRPSPSPTRGEAAAGGWEAPLV